MIDPKVAATVAEQYRLAGGFRPFLITLLAVAHGDGQAWEPPSKAALRRALTRPNDETTCSEDDAQSALDHAMAMGLVGEGSNLRRIALLSSGEVAA